MIIKNYKLLLDEIEADKKSLEMINKEIKHLSSRIVGHNMSDLKAIDYSKTRVQEGSKIGFGDYLERIQRLVESAKKTEEHLNEQTQSLRSIEDIIDRCDCASYADVIYCRRAMKLTLEKTAEQTGYSVSQVKRIEKMYS